MKVSKKKKSYRERQNQEIFSERQRKYTRGQFPGKLIFVENHFEKLKKKSMKKLNDKFEKFLVENPHLKDTSKISKKSPKL